MTSQSSRSRPTRTSAPAYGGSADEGVRSSVPATTRWPATPPSLIRAEFGKLYDLYGDLVALLDAAAIRPGPAALLRRRPGDPGVPGGVQRVVVPEVPDAAG